MKLYIKVPFDMLMYAYSTKLHLVIRDSFENLNMKSIIESLRRTLNICHRFQIQYE